MYRSIAIDGPAGAGKSTIAKAVATELKYIYVDTGALYRAIGLFVNAKGFDTTDAKAIESLLNEIKVELKIIDGAQRVYLNGQDVSEHIRQPEMSMFASNVSAIPVVREFLLELQCDIAKSNNIIMDGRDIGTVILPNADVKIFLTASPEVRAKRRYDEHIAKGQTVNFDELLKEITQRDYNDSNREIAPLKQADDAILIDTSGNTLQESIDIIKNTITQKLNS